MLQYQPGLLDGLSNLSHYETRSVCAENLTGEKGKGGMATDGTGASCSEGLGQGWKISPSLNLAAHRFREPA